MIFRLITLLNDGTLIAIGYDNVTPSKQPERWNLRVLFTIGFVLGTVAACSSLLLLWILLDSWNPTSVFHALHFKGLSYGQITTGIYLQISVIDFLTLFSARTGPNWFFHTMPSYILLSAAMISLIISTLLACFWPSSYPDDIYTHGLVDKQGFQMLPLYIWLYSIAGWLLQDALKVFTYYLLKKFNIFDINNNGIISHYNMNDDINDERIALMSDA